ncbi:hypothetical protein ANO11243_055000 [Dothideomycetidae sp. 11243]|nr:hypothetical protein ANO11243_055000 [fungal sp. No.11243]
MANLATCVFLNSPFASIAVCQCGRITAANNAAVSFLCNDDVVNRTDYVCGSTCHEAPLFESLHLKLEDSAHSWELAFKRACDKSLRCVLATPGFSRDEVYFSFSRIRKPEILPRHDSPLGEAFPEFAREAETQRSQSLLPEDRYTHVAEQVRAKAMITSFTHDGRRQYVLGFHDIVTTQIRYDGREIADRGPTEHWLSRCKEAIFDSQPFLGYLVDPEGNFCYLNRLCRKLAGDVSFRDVPKSEAKSPLYTHDFSRKLRYEELPALQIIRTRTPLSSYIYGQIDPLTGARHVVKAWGSPVYDTASGEFLGSVVFCEVLGLFDEINHNRDLERLKSFETICDTMPHFVWTADAKGYGEWFSSQWLAFTGLHPDECRGWGWQQTIWPEDLARFLEEFEKAHENAETYEVEVRCRRHDGVYRWMLKKGAPIKDNDGKVLLWTGTNTEIHDSVVARMQAQLQRDQIVKAMENAKFNVWAVAKDPFQLTMLEGSLNIMEFMQQQPSTALLNRSKEGERIADSFPDVEGIAEVSKAVREVMRGNQPGAEIEVYWNQTWHKVRVMPDIVEVDSEIGRRGDIRGVIGCSIDITAEKLRSALESDNRQLSEEKHLAKEQNRMKSQFLANMSHEIRTPVAGVIGLANLLLDTNLDVDQRDNIESIQMSAQTLLMIVNDILDFSKVESGKLTLEYIQFNLATLVTNLWKVMHHTANQKSVDFSCTLNVPADLCVHGDPGRIRQILTNLVSNAIKFTPSGGTVQLNVTALPTQDGARVVFMVEDSGIGIKKDVLANLFKPFQQGDSSTARLFGGSGLGLSISRSLAMLMKGHIELESEADIGTTATFSVPMAMSDPTKSLTDEGPRCLRANPRPRSHQGSSGPSTPSPRRPSLAGRRTKSNNERASNTKLQGDFKARDALQAKLPMEERSKVHVLLAEDNAVNRLIAMRAVEKLGFSVSAVWNGKEVLDYLATEESATHRRADIVLMDCQMPVMDGYLATQKIRNEAHHPRLRDIPIIAMTASAIQGDREKCFDAGMSDYLSKPVEVHALEATLVKWTLYARKGAAERENCGCESVLAGAMEC